MPGLRPLSREEMTAFEAQFHPAEAEGRHVPDLARTLARRPDIVKAHQALRKTNMGPGGVSQELKSLIAQVSSLAAGCGYCAAHSVHQASELGVPLAKLRAIASFETNAVFSAAECAVLIVAHHAAQVPNRVSDAEFEALKTHFDDTQIVEILAVIGMYGYFNRINDTLATELEQAPACTAAELLGPQGWRVGRHGS